MPRSVLYGSLSALLAFGGCDASDSAGQAPAKPQQEYDANGCVPQSTWKIEPGAVCVHTLAAAVKDLDGSPVPDLITTACGSGCTYGKTDPSGLTRMEVRRYMVKPALMLHGRSKRASYYSRFEAGGAVDKGVLFLPAMPFDQGVDLPQNGAAKTVSFGDVTFDFAAGANVRIDQIELEGPDEQRFRVITVPLDKTPPFVAEAGGNFAVVYAMTPFGTRIKPAATVTIANAAKLPAGAAVELFQQGSDVFDESFGPYGGFSKIADAHVSADGAMIKTDDGQGVSEITWLGVRLKSSAQ